MDTIQRQSIDQNLRKLVQKPQDFQTFTHKITADILKILKLTYLNGKKNRPQTISSINVFNFVNLKNELLAFLGWPYYILEKLTIL